MSKHTWALAPQQSISAHYQVPAIAHPRTGLWSRSKHRRAPRPRRSSWSPWVWVVLGEGLIAAVILAATALFLLYHSDLIMPGVHTLGIELGGMSKAEAVTALQENWQQRAIILHAGKTTYGINPALLGITFDAEATAQAAYQQGRLKVLQDTSVSPVLRIDSPTATANLQSLAPQFNKPPVNAGVRIANGRVEMTPPLAGQTVDVATTVTQLEQNLAQIVATGKLNMVMLPVQPAIIDTSAVAAQANQLLVSPLFFRVYDPITGESLVWTAAPEVWGAWLSLSVDPQDITRLNWNIDAEKAKAFLDAQSAVLGPDRYVDSNQAVAGMLNAITARRSDISLRVYHRERQHTVQSGETLSSIGRVYGMPYAWIQQANPGVENELYVGQVLTIPSPDVLLPLAVVENKRIVVSIADQKMWAFENGVAKWEWPVSTGIASSYTASGVFQIQTHERDAYAGNWNLWMPYFMGIYRPVPTSDFMNGFHGFPTRNGSQLLWTNSLGRPVTYGCILISTENAATLYGWAEEGVVVEIRP